MHGMFNPLSAQEHALIPQTISSTTDAIIFLCGCAQPYARTAIEKIWGRPITILPPQKRVKNKQEILDDLLAQLNAQRGDFVDRRRFRDVINNPRRENSAIGHRYSFIKEGMTVGEYLTRGGKQKDIRSGLRRGYFTLEEGH